MDSFDDIARRLREEGVGDDSVFDAIRSQAVMVSTYWRCLKACGVPEADATTLTLEWMGLCAGPADE